MEQVCGKIKKGDSVLIENVSILIDSTINKKSKLKEWHGSFVLPALKNITPGSPFQLFLDDGRSGNIIITDIKITSSAKQLFYFMGSGPLL